MLWSWVASMMSYNASWVVYRWAGDADANEYGMVVVAIGERGDGTRRCEPSKLASDTDRMAVTGSATSLSDVGIGGGRQILCLDSGFETQGARQARI